MAPLIWQCRGHRFELALRPLVMGILNVTPDSFSDGARFFDPATAIEQGLKLASLGADILDIGGESTRPGAQPVPLDEELRRVVPVVAALAKQSSLPLSIDTMKAEVARQCLEAGAAIVNDVSGLLGDNAMPAIVAEYRAGVVLMHMQGTPVTMQLDPRYDDVVAETGRFFEERLHVLTAAGIERESICLDPGIGFGKTSIHNLELLANLGELARFGRPVCLGVSRKRFFGSICGRDLGDRDAISLAAACFAAARGEAQVLRVHDVGPARDAAVLLEAIDRYRR